MKAAHVRCAFFSCLMAVGTVPLNGCAVSGKTFAIDSNSRVPFFGLELQERKQKSSAPAYRSIARTSHDSARVETILQTVPSIFSGASKKRRQQPIVVSSSDEASFEENLAKRSTKNESTPSIPLPRTDARSVPVEPRSRNAVFDFQ